MTKKIKLSLVALSAIFFMVFLVYDGEQEPMSTLVSKKSYSILEVLVEWVNERYSREQYFDLVDLEDIDLGKSVNSTLEDETDDLKDWLIGSPAYNMKKLDFSKREDKFINFSDRDGIIYALWYYPELKGEPPVVKFSEYYPAVVASSLEEFVCRIGRESIKNEYSFEYWAGEITERLKQNDDEKAKKLLLEDYNLFRKRLEKVVDCTLFKSHAEAMKRHEIVLVPQLKYKVEKKELTGDDIVKLINISISNTNVLSALEKFGFHTPLYPLKDGDFDTGTSSIKDIGINFDFSDIKETDIQKADPTETLYLNDIEFDYTFKYLPFGLTSSDNVEIVSKKLSDFKAYIDPESNSSKYWYPPGKQYHIRIDFEDDDPKELYTVTIQTYWTPARLKLISAE